MLYIGDLSKNDAAVLADAAKVATRILEFGVGGSTQIFARSAPPGATITSVETDAGWIAKTTAILRAMDLAHRVRFLDYESWRVGLATSSERETYDVILDDGIDTLREDFAVRAWPSLEIGGKLIFHDTRRPRDIANVLKFCFVHYVEIGSMALNVNSSNLTVLTKKAPEPYENWNFAEGREPVTVGNGSTEESVAYVLAALGRTRESLVLSGAG
jgi:hypothetical protein